VPTYSAILTEQALQLGYRLKESHQVLLIRATPVAGSSTRSFANVVDNWLRSQAYRALIVWRNEGLLVVIESRSLESGKGLAEKMVAGLSHPAQPMLIGLGCTFNTISDNDATLQESYEQAREAAAIGAALGKQDGIITFEELGILHWLYHLPPEQRSQNSYMQHLDTLAAYDKKRDTELIKTLETYLEHGGSLVETAKALYVHRNTLLHRVNRIEALCGLQLRNPIQRLNLHAAVKSYRLHQ
jgi:sugar diacid utilization regulator